MDKRRMEGRERGRMGERKRNIAKQEWEKHKRYILSLP